MQHWERALYLASIVVLSGLALYLGLRAEPVASATDAAPALTALRAESERLKLQVASLQTELDQARQRPVVALSDVDIAHMKEQGLKDPPKDLVADLEAHPEVIPFQPKFGVQAHAGAWLVNSSWVLASVGDGHKGMWALLAYQVENGRIHWTVLATAD